jgi:hypothetical protein
VPLCVAASVVAEGLGDGRSGRSPSSVGADVVEEVARHVGHMDVVREQLDGTKGCY